MSRGLALGVALVILVPALAMAKGLPGEYPEPLRQWAESLPHQAASEAWPPGRPVHPEAESFLEPIDGLVAEGRLAAALDSYVLWRIENGAQHLAEDLAALPASVARSELRNATASLVSDARALVAVGRSTINAIDPDTLTVAGAETAVWGALILSRAEYQLNVFDEVSARGLYTGAAVDENVIRQVLQPVLGGQTLAAAGIAIASLAPSVPGRRLPAGEMFSRLDAIAKTPIITAAPEELTALLPRGNRTLDSPQLRAGLLLLSAEELRGQEIRRQYLNAAGRQDITDAVNKALAFDRTNLEPWARAGSPLALSSYEAVSVRYDRVTEFDIGMLTRARAAAQAAAAAEALLDPEPPRPTPAPVGGFVLVALVAGAAAWRGRRGLSS